METNNEDDEYIELANTDFDWRSFFNECEEVPYIIHFIFGLMEQSEPFSFVHYISVLSAYIANPEAKSIYIHYHHTIYGEWWDRLQKEVPCLQLKQIDIPTHIGMKEIKKTAHRADKARMDILWEMGGIYMDMDTISHKSMKPFLKDNTTLCKQYSLGVNNKKEPIKYIGGICNAIMITKPKSKFFRRWLDAYERAFEPDKWEEASIWLPLRLAKEFHHEVVVLEPEVFNVPGYWESKKMFDDACFEVPLCLVALHLCESKSKEYIKRIHGWEWYHENRYTLYGKMMDPCYIKLF